MPWSALIHLAAVHWPSFPSNSELYHRSWCGSPRRGNQDSTLATVHEGRTTATCSLPGTALIAPTAQFLPRASSSEHQRGKALSKDLGQPSQTSDILDFRYIASVSVIFIYHLFCDLLYFVFLAQLVKNLLAMKEKWLCSLRICLQCRKPDFNLWVRKIPWRKE